MWQKFITAVFLGSFLALGFCSKDPTSGGTPDGQDQQQRKNFAQIVFDWHSVSSDTNLSANDKLRTHRNSFATIKLQDGTTMQLGPESLMALSGLIPSLQNRQTLYSFTLEKGKVETEMENTPKSASGITIKTPSAEATLIPREVSFQ